MSVVKTAWGLVKGRLEAISGLNVYVGRSSLHKLTNADESVFPAAIMQVGSWARESDGRSYQGGRVQNDVTFDVDLVVSGGDAYEALFDALADVTEAIESTTDPYLRDPASGRNILNEGMRITDPTLEAPDAGGQLETLSFGIALNIPTLYGEPRNVI